MSYALRLTLLASAVFFLNYVSLSLCVAAAWRLVRKRAAWNAGMLYVLRIAPVGVAIGVVGVLVIPSFLYLEPFGTGESFGLPALTLAFGGIAVVAAGIASMLFASWRTARFVAACQKIGHIEVTGSRMLAIEIAAATPILVIAGAYEPRLLISEELRRILEVGEMQAAIQHELAHITRRDNLKKLVLRAIRFPFLSGVERDWVQAAEIAADEAAVSNESTALDLASALIKVASQSHTALLPDIAMSLVPYEESALRLRVERLLAWTPTKRKSGSRPYFLIALALSCLFLLALSHGPLLQHAHELTELFVR
ncbi:MAG TPA: M56 family metallopeptidase [Terriglobales bacterium]|nr:M56 family metallopeptidase [Terriglobales bacterium]